MAEWEHKERTWFTNHAYDDIDGNRLYHQNPPITFPMWLDEQCAGGWEVFKISRDFNHGTRTWCIFRRLV